MTLFSPTYTTARERFLDAAHRAGAVVESIAVMPKGPLGEPLFIDIATLGQQEAQGVAIVSSGLHGIEGFVGSAVQLAWLQRIETRGAPRDVKVVLAHALNPFGFAWLRRWNEHNVDLNRNFLPDRWFVAERDYLASLAIYQRLSPFLNPPSPPSRWEPYMLKAAGRMLAEGLGALQKALPVGQYEHEKGLFYGGRGPEETTTTLREWLPIWTAKARLAVHVDIHSGLGRWGEVRILIVDAQHSARAEWVSAHFGNQVRDQASYRAHGTMAEEFRYPALPCIYHGLTAEFGTYSGMRVLGALRAENRAHFYAPPESPAYLWAKRRVLEAFVPRSSRWRNTVVTRGVALVDRAVDVCRDERSHLDPGDKTGRT